MPTPSRKNLLLISLDDCVAFWRYRDLFGQTLQTPNLDRICAQSTAFHAAYSQVPLCGPSRASFMSGQSPHTLGIFSNKVSVFDRISPKDMWAYRLKEQGWFCSSGGKVHHGFRPRAEEPHNVLYNDERKHFRIDIKLPPNREQTALGGHGNGLATLDPADDHRYYDANSADSAIEFLNGQKPGAPFYREIGFFGPHTPFITPLRYKKLYRYGKMRQPEAWANGWDHNAFADTFMRENLDLKRNLHWQKSVRNYFSALSHVDHHLGRVWDALKASSHAENTLVVILSDHGFHLGEKHRFRKTSLWEQVAGVPFILHDPARPEARVVNDPVAVIDVGPTVLDWMGLPPLENSPGVSLLLCMEGAPPPDRAIPTFFNGSTGIRYGDYRFIRYEDGSTELFNIRDDWWCLKNLGPDHPEHAPMLERLMAMLPDWGVDPARHWDVSGDDEDDD